MEQPSTELNGPADLAPILKILPPMTQEEKEEEMRNTVKRDCMNAILARELMQYYDDVTPEEITDVLSNLND